MISFIGQNDRVPAWKTTIYSPNSNFCEPDLDTEMASRPHLELGRTYSIKEETQFLRKYAANTLVRLIKSTENN